MSDDTITSPGDSTPQLHACPTPPLPQTTTFMARPDWTCRRCGKVWRMLWGQGVLHWAEVRGATND